MHPTLLFFIILKELEAIGELLIVDFNSSDHLLCWYHISTANWKLTSLKYRLPITKELEDTNAVSVVNVSNSYPVDCSNRYYMVEVLFNTPISLSGPSTILIMSCSNNHRSLIF